jgi:2-oxoglutaroyl-CoA hydrolase
MTDPAPLLPALPDRFDGFRLEIDPARERADVILDRAPLNVITMAEREQLRAVFEALDADARVRVIVLRAEGEHFSSGGEIRGFLDASPEHVSRLAWNIAAPARCRKPVIAASRGYCFGVGFELALACDFRLVSETCLYSLPEQRLGQIPGSGGAARLQKMVGITRAKDIVMRSRRIPGRQAYEWGVATDCVADDELEAASDALAEELRGFPPLALALAFELDRQRQAGILDVVHQLFRAALPSLVRMPVAGRDRSPSPSRRRWSNGALPWTGCVTLASQLRWSWRATLISPRMRLSGSWSNTGRCRRSWIPRRRPSRMRRCSIRPSARMWSANGFSATAIRRPHLPKPSIEFRSRPATRVIPPRRSNAFIMYRKEL